MLLAIDIGNTNVSCGIFHGMNLISRCRFATELCKDLRSVSRIISLRVCRRYLGSIEGICIASVVPRLDPVFRDACKRIFGVKPLFATYKNIGIPIVGYNPRQVGADRLVNVLAAYKRYRKALIVVDLGTATTFDCVNSKGEYVGGAISPGIELANRSLYEAAAKLPWVSIGRSKRIVGRNTKESIQSGVFHGYIGLVDHLIHSISREKRMRPKVIATGGLAKLIANDSSTIEGIHPDLTLEGLRMVWERRAC